MRRIADLYGKEWIEKMRGHTLVVAVCPMAIDANDQTSHETLRYTNTVVTSK